MKNFLILSALLFFINTTDIFSQQEPSQYLNEGIAANEARAYEDAVKYLTQYLNSDPQNAVGLYNRAVAYFFLKDFNNAQRDALAAIENNSNYKEAYNILGLTNTALILLPDAVSDFTSAINIDPDYSEAYLNRALVFKQQNDYARAVTDLNSALTISPGMLEAVFIRGQVLVSMGNYSDAIKDLTMYISSVPDKAAAFSVRGLAYYQVGNYPESVRDLEKAIRLDPGIEKDFTEVLNDAKSKMK
ncbi:MAG: tetratricopeptide repeat protein [bacterium]